VTLSKDGTFTTVGWPTDLEGATSDPQSWPVSFSFHKISAYWDSDVRGGYYGGGLMVSGSRENPRLYEFVGDPDNCDLVTFTRASACLFDGLVS
jgi:hypothetical protein